MRVLRGRAPDPDRDRQRTSNLLASVAESGEAAVRVWTPHRQLAFGRRDANSDGYDDAVAAARDHGFPPVERSVGGRAVAYTGTTVAFARFEPIDDIRVGATDRYEALVDVVQRALWDLGVPAQRGEPERSFCPGDHSLSYRGKVAGIAQRVTSGAALVSGVVTVDGHDEIAGVLDPVYDALGVPFDPRTVGSLERAGGATDTERVIRTLEGALVGDEEPAVERVDRQT
ncbi:biotin/lipoate A/B protein ligase family protein [Halobacteriaceae archaeon GCM10025711]